MKQLLLFFLLVCLAGHQAHAQDKDEQPIRQLLSVQTTAWNKGSLEQFMQTYWQSDSLLFMGKTGPHYGWSNALANYKKSYPDTTAMGQLHFDILQMRRLSPVYFFVAGRWHLQRSIGNLDGSFTLLLQKINGRWLIVADHSS